MDWLLVVWIVGVIATWWWAYWDCLEGGRHETHADFRLVCIMVLWLPFWIIVLGAWSFERLEGRR